MTKGIVYLLTNPCLEGWVKIGMTGKDDIAARLKSLNASTSIPLSFRVYAEYHVEKPEEVEQSIHKLIDLVDSDLRAREFDDNARIIREREFFQISVENAYKIFKEVARLRNDSNALVLISPTEEEIEEQEIAQRKQRKKWNEELFFKSVVEGGVDKAEGISTLYDFSKEIGQIRWGTGSVQGSFSTIAPKLSKRSLYTVFHGGTLQLNVGWLKDTPQVKERLSAIVNSLFGLTEATNHKGEWYPSVSFEEWEPKLKEFKQAISELLAQCDI